MKEDFPPLSDSADDTVVSSSSPKPYPLSESVDIVRIAGLSRLDGPTSQDSVSVFILLGRLLEEVGLVSRVWRSLSLPSVSSSPISISACTLKASSLTESELMIGPREGVLLGEESNPLAIMSLPPRDSRMLSTFSSAFAPRS